MEAAISRDGSGIFSKPSGTTAPFASNLISSTTFNTLIDDFVTDANTARPITAGGTGATSASAARTALGVQALDATLTAFAALLTASGKVPYATGTDTASEADSTSYGRSLWNVASEAALKTLINAEAGVDFQAYDADTAKTDVATDWTAAQAIRPKLSAETSGTPTSASANKVLQLTGGLTAPDAVFTALDTMVLDPGTSNRTITRGSGVTMYVNGTDSATATVLANTLASLHYRSASVCILSGSGVS